MEQIKDDLGWLIRDTKNVIRGPFAYSEILQMIKKGQLKGKTEISKANTYWFAIEEKPELGKFFPELGINTKSIEEPAEMTMTGTMTKVSDENKEEGDYTTVTDITYKTDPDVQPENEEAKIEWLSDEFADEFGFGSDNETTAISTKNLIKTKGDALPSEMKENKTERPKPMNTVLKSALDKSQSSTTQASSTITVPVSSMETGAKIFRDDTPDEKETKSKLAIYLAIFFILFLLAAGGGFYVLKISKSSTAPVATVKTDIVVSGRKLEPLDAARRGLLLLDLEQTKDAAGQIGLSNSHDPNFHMAQGLMKKEFLSDTDGAITSLKTARPLLSDPEVLAEIDNLLALYTFDSSNEEAISLFKKALGAKNDPVIRYNLGLALFRSGKFADSLATINTLNPGNDSSLAESLYVLQGWDKYFLGSADGSDELFFQKALAADPFSPKARLGLAVRKLKAKADKGEDVFRAIRDSEAEFRTFLDLAPEVDSSTYMPEFRKMSDFEIYALARKEIAELNVPDSRAKTRPSSIIMAADAMLSSLLSRSGESLNIVESAMKMSPGDANILKAYGYLRWKESRYDDVIDLLKDTDKLKNSFASNLLLGKSYEKNGRLDVTEKYFQNLTVIAPARSEGWALLGEVRLKQKNNAEAKKLFKTALDKDPNNLIAVQGLEQLNEDVVVNSSFYRKKLPF